MKRGVYKKKIIQLLQSGKLYTLAEIHTHIPEANFSTVYRNVEQLQSEGVVREISIDKNTTQYELNTKTHGHFVCDKCTAVECVSVPRSFLANKEVTDVVAHGVCADCI